ncbi:MAG: DUF2299 family protein [Desulfurococcaceae archaeon]
MLLRDIITKWLLEEAYIVSRLEAPPEARVSWSLNVATPGALGVRFSVISPMDRPDKVVLVMGIAISHEHRDLLEKLKLTERIKVLHSILSKALPVCIDCKIAVQPNITNPQTITINMELFEEEIEKYGKPYFIRVVARLLNTYLAVVSGFNEWFPVVPPIDKGKEPQTFM